jgi:hypothetical protein
MSDSVPREQCREHGAWDPFRAVRARVYQTYRSGPGRARLLVSTSGADTALNNVDACIDLGRLTNMEISRRSENRCRDLDAMFDFGLLRNPNNHSARAASGLKSTQT